MRQSVALLICLILAEATCSRSAQYYVNRGDRLFKNGKYEDASIQYRKAIQKDSKAGEAYYRLGLSEARRREYGAAYSAFTRAVELMPNNDQAKARLADIYLSDYLSNRQSTGSYNQVVKISDQLLAKEPGSFDGLRLKGLLAQSDKKYKEAVTYLEKANRIKPMDPEVIVGLCQSLFLDMRAQEGERLAQELIERDKSFGPIYDLLFLQYSRTNRRADAERILRAKADNNPKDGAYLLELAQYYKQAGQETEMTAVLGKLLGNPNDFPKGRLMVGDFYGRAGKWKEAIVEYNEGERSNRKDTLLFQERKVNALIAMGSKAEASRLLDQIIREHPKEGEARGIRATMLLDGGDPKDVSQAVAEFQALVKEDPANALLHFNLGRALLAKRDLAAARPELVEAIRRRSDYLPPRFALAILNLNQQRPAEALRYADEILQFEPGNVQAKLLRAAGLTGLGNYRDARSQLERILKDAPESKETPDSAEARFQLGMLELAQKNYKEAEKTLETLRQSGSNSLRVNAALVETYAAQNQPEKAIAMLNGELRKSPDSMPLRKLLASTADRAGRLDLAISEYQQIIAQDSKSADVYARFGDLYRRHGDFDNAIAMLKQANRLAPNDAGSAALLAGCLAMSGRIGEAIPAYHRVLELQPDDASTQNSLAFLIAETGGNLDEAQRLAQRAIQKVPERADFNDTLGWIYTKKNMHGAAEQIFSVLVAKEPNNPTYRYHLGVALLGKGDAAGARLALSGALTQAPAKDEVQKIRELLAKLN